MNIKEARKIIKSYGCSLSSQDKNAGGFVGNIFICTPLEDSLNLACKTKNKELINALIVFCESEINKFLPELTRLIQWDKESFSIRMADKIKKYKRFTKLEWRKKKLDFMIKVLKENK